MKFFIFLISTLACSVSFALPPEDAQKLYDEISPSLLAVQYTVDGEFGRRELIGQGIVIGEEGTVIASLALFPTQIPDEQMKDFKIIIPGDEEKEIDAVFLGRDERSNLAFLKTKEKQNWKPVHFQDITPKIGQTILSVGLLPKRAGYRPCCSCSVAIVATPSRKERIPSTAAVAADSVVKHVIPCCRAVRRMYVSS